MCIENSIPADDGADNKSLQTASMILNSIFQDKHETDIKFVNQ